MILFSLTTFKLVAHFTSAMAYFGQNSGKRAHRTYLKSLIGKIHICSIAVIFDIIFKCYDTKYYYYHSMKYRYEYINTIILDFITISIHQSSEGEYYGYFLALHDLLKATEYIGASGNFRIATSQIQIPTASKMAEVRFWDGTIMGNF